MELDIKTKKSLIQIRDLKSEREKTYEAWLRNIIVMAVGFLGISVGLKTHKVGHIDSIQFLFWNLQLLFLVVGILCGTIRLFGSIHQLDDLVLGQYRKLKNSTPDSLEDDSYRLPIAIVNLGIVYKIAEKVCYISFVLALACVLTVSLLDG